MARRDSDPQDGAGNAKPRYEPKLGQKSRAAQDSRREASRGQDFPVRSEERRGELVGAFEHLEQFSFMPQEGPVLARARFSKEGTELATYELEYLDGIGAIYAIRRTPSHEGLEEDFLTTGGPDTLWDRFKAAVWEHLQGTS